MGEKDLALKVAERAIMLLPSAKDALDRPANGREPGANSDYSRREQTCDLDSHPTCYKHRILAGFTAQRPLRRPFLGSIRSGTPLRADPAFQKLCEEKQK